MKIIKNLTQLGDYLNYKINKFMNNELLLAVMYEIRDAISEQAEIFGNSSQTGRKFLKMKKSLEREIQNVMEKDPAAKNALEIILTYAGFHAVIGYRVANWFFRRKQFTIARIISQFVRFITGIEIHPGATIGKGLFIDHGMGVVIGETAIVGDNCLIYQGVTLGGTGKDKGKRRHPRLGDNVMVGAGARVLGNFTVGDNAKIAANAVVLKDVPPNYTAVGVPARLIPPADERPNDNSTLDQTHIPDPVLNDIQTIKSQIQHLSALIQKVEEDERLCRKRFE